MIHKIEKIVSVGKFREFNASGDIAFKKLTLIYSDNGLGKTTLAAIIRSLVENNVAIIQKRITTNTLLDQSAQIVQRVDAVETFHTYRSTGWSNPFENIDIFDSHFVNDNIYSGFNFDAGHGQNLHHFTVGAAGVQIRGEIEKNKADKTAKRALIDKLKEAISQQIGFGLSESEVNSLVSLTESDATNIETRIVTAQTNLNNAQANQVIQTLQPLAPLNAVSVSTNFVGIILDLQASVEGIQDETLDRLFRDHCQELSSGGIAGPEKWLRLGHNFLAQTGDITCPFCTQPVNNTELLRAYAQVFNDDFNSLIRRLEDHKTILQSFNLEASIQGVNLTHNQNPNRIASWQSYLPRETVIPDFSFMPEIGVIRESFDNLGRTIEAKIANPSIATSSDSASALQALLQSINRGINNYNQTVQEFNSQITRFKSSIGTIVQAQNEFNRLSRIRQRFQPNIVTLFAQLVTEQGNLQALDTAYPLLIVQQETAANTFFTQFGTTVNGFLRDTFRTPFKIINVQNIRPQGKGTQSRFGYTLTINEQPISFDHTQTNNVRDCLSEGDKSTLALAFFLAKLENDPNKSDKIVILDDPLSSFDKNRRFQTIAELLKLFKGVRQLVVLSHDGKFLYDLNRRVRRADKRGLKIAYDEANNTSTISAFDIEKSLQNDYFICLDKIRSFIVTGTDSGKRDMRREIRISLEYHLIFKFYNQLGTVEGTFGNLINRLNTLLTEGSIQFRDTNGQSVIDDLQELNEISWDSHHGDGDVFETVTEIPIEQITLPELKSYLQKALDLINDRI